MTNKEIADFLGTLVQLDFDATKAYDEAIDNIDDPAIKSNFEQFRADHQRHIVDINAEIYKLGEEPRELSRDIKGFLIEGFTAIRSLTGTDGALKAMDGNEKLTNKKYKAAIEKDVPWDIKDLLERNYEDEQHHLAYIDQQLHVRA
jgi:uncharacterized protein (TIGR02284 family)